MRPDIVKIYFIPITIGIATKQTCKDNGKLYPKFGLAQPNGSYA